MPNSSSCFHYYRNDFQGQLQMYPAPTTTTQMACCPGCQPPFCPGFGTGTRLPGQKPRGFCPGWQNRDKRCLTLKKILHTTGFDPKTSYLVHGFLANSPK